MVIKGIESGIGLSKAFPTQPAAAGDKGRSTTEGFSKFMGEMIEKVNNTQQDADKAVQNLATGEGKGLHEVMIAMEKSSISFQFLAQVRNKAVEAYQEVMRMPV